MIRKHNYSITLEYLHSVDCVIAERTLKALGQLLKLSGVVVEFKVMKPYAIMNRSVFGEVCDDLGYSVPLGPHHDYHLVCDIDQIVKRDILLMELEVEDEQLQQLVELLTFPVLDVNDGRMPYVVNKHTLHTLSENTLAYSYGTKATKNA